MTQGSNVPHFREVELSNLQQLEAALDMFEDLSKRRYDALLAPSPVLCAMRISAARMALVAIQSSNVPKELPQTAQG